MLNQGDNDIEIAMHIKGIAILAIGNETKYLLDVSTLDKNLCSSIKITKISTLLLAELIYSKGLPRRYILILILLLTYFESF